MDKLKSEKFNRSNFPNRPQTVSGVPMEIRDASWYFQERAAFRTPDIDIIDSNGLFDGDEVIIGIWKPNVFLLIPDEEEHLRFAAKSLWRAPSILEETKGRIQSSIFFILKGLSIEEINKLRETAGNHQWGRSITCVNANMQVLHDAGIALWNGESLDNIYLTVPLFKQIAEHGLISNNRNINIEVLKTTKKYLENQLWETTKATILTPVRHIQRKFSKKIQEGSNSPIPDHILPVGEYVMQHEQHHKSDLTLRASSTSKLAVPFRLLWGPHTIFSVNQDRIDIDDFLPQELQEYSQENPSWSTRIKRDYLFNKYIVGAINSFLQRWYTDFPHKSESDLHNLFETHTVENPCKYNIVSSKSWSMLMKIDVGNKMIDWILTKHVLISNYAKSIRFAWEIWKDQKGVIWVNRNSGTYMPTEASLLAFVEYLKAIFPNVDFRADTQI